MKTGDIPKIRELAACLRNLGYNFTRRRLIRSYFLVEHNKLMDFTTATKQRIQHRCKLVRNVAVTQSLIDWPIMRKWALTINEDYEMSNKGIVNHALENNWLIFNFDETHLDNECFNEAGSQKASIGLKGQPGQKKKKHPNSQTFLLGICNRQHVLTTIVVTKSKKSITN
jgi:hypothetical protein